MSKQIESPRTPTPERRYSFSRRSITHVASAQEETKSNAANVGDNRAAAPDTGNTSSSGGAVVPMPSLRDPFEDKIANDDEGKLVSSPSSGSPVGPPSWSNYIAGRTWMPAFSIEEALPAVAVTLALGAIVYAVVILGRSPKPRPGGCR
ncbi:hypothetical protein MRX96_009472 [Rhipicephalus microplus]